MIIKNKPYWTVVAWYTQPYNLAVLQYNSTLEVEKSNKLKYVGQGFVHDVQYKKNIIYRERRMYLSGKNKFILQWDQV